MSNANNGVIHNGIMGLGATLIGVGLAGAGYHYLPNIVSALHVPADDNWMRVYFTGLGAGVGAAGSYALGRKTIGGAVRGALTGAVTTVLALIGIDAMQHTHPPHIPVASLFMGGPG